MVPPTAVNDAKSGGSGVSVKDPVKDTILTPRFYTTDFEAMAEMDLRPNEAELEAICEEFRKDYNRHHFVRNEEFDGAADKLDPETRRVFIEFLNRVALLNSQVSFFTKNSAAGLKRKTHYLPNVSAIWHVMKRVTLAS